MTVVDIGAYMFVGSLAVLAAIGIFAVVSAIVELFRCEEVIMGVILALLFVMLCGAVLMLLGVVLKGGLMA